ncbi:MAG: DUF3341 domain-containing protein [Gemmatimonadetes bacterium]|nr:DUF3341 domain-containing protein [Gemmatimonadota bacterium]
MADRTTSPPPVGPGNDPAPSPGAAGGLLASFEYLDSTVEAIHELRKAGFKGLKAYMPYPEHHIEEAMGYGESPVRVWALVGGLTGAATGFGFTIFTSMDWPLITGGKPMVSIPAYVVIAFELTILFGALATVIGLFINSRIPQLKAEAIYDPEFMGGRFGIFVPASGGEAAEARRILQRHEPARLTDGRDTEVARG